LRGADLEKCRNKLVEKVKAKRTPKFERVLAHICAQPASTRTDLQRSTLEREQKIHAEITRGVIRTAVKVTGGARILWKFAVSRGYVPRNIVQDVKKSTLPPRMENDVIDENILNPMKIERLIQHTPPSIL
jgi:hypothetical protein